MEEAGHGGDLKIFASDVDREVLEQATAGRCPETVAADLGPARTNRFLGRRGRGWQVVRALREKMIFARHDLLRDAPFTRLHLVCCRNLLVHLRPEAQTRAVSALHYALRPLGYLMLGASESLAGLDDEFVAVDRRWRIFEKRRGRPPASAPSRGAADTGTTVSQARPAIVADDARIRPEMLLESGFATLLARRDAACLVVSNDHELLHAYGRTGLFLGVPPGEMTRDVARLLVRELALPVGIALHRTARGDATVAFGGVRLEDEKGRVRRAEVRATRRVGDRWTPDFPTVVLELLPGGEADKAGGPPTFDAEGESTARIAMLERVREDLQSTITELEVANEEQQSTNQELLSSNEELQSTNEELYTVNAEHQARITDSAT